MATIAAFAVVVLGIWQFKEQSRQTRKSLALTRLQARRSQRAVEIAHRPRLVVQPIFVDGIDDWNIGVELTNGEAWITNTGVFNATLQFFRADWFFLERLPVRNPIWDVADTTTAPALIRPGHRAKVKLPNYSIGMEAFKAIQDAFDLAKSHNVADARPGALYLLGYIKWTDRVGLRRSYFAFVFSPHRHRFEPVEHPNYSYEA